MSPLPGLTLVESFVVTPLVPLSIIHFSAQFITLTLVGGFGNLMSAADVVSKSKI